MNEEEFELYVKVVQSYLKHGKLKKNLLEELAIFLFQKKIIPFLHPEYEDIYKRK